MDKPHKRQRTSGLKKLRESLPGLVIESVLITFGVLVAFAADSWKAQARLEKDTQQVLANLQHELIGNRSIVLEWKSYYDSLRYKMRSIIEQPGEIAEFTESGWEGSLYPEPTVSYLPQETAWQTARSTQVIRNFQYNTTYHLTHSYRYQTDIENTRQLIFEMRYLQNSREPVIDHLRSLMALYGELTQQQQYLLGAYRDALIALDQELISRGD